MATQRETLQPHIRQTRPFRSEAQEAVVAILRTAEVVRHHLTRAVEPHGVTLQQYNVLRILRGVYPDPLPTLEVAERLIERTPGITRFLDRLEEKGLVRRERRAEDRRQVHCWITPTGLDLLHSMDAGIDQADEDSVRTLKPEQVRQLVGLLQQVRHGLGG